MTTEQLQFLFALFSFVGVVGILFYIIIEKEKRDKMDLRIRILEKELISLKDSFSEEKEDKTINNEAPKAEDMKDKIVALYEEGADIMLIEDALNIPKAKIEMVLKFHTLNKSDNWRESVDNNL